MILGVFLQERTKETLPASTPTVGSIAPAEVSEPCPTSEGFAGGDGSEKIAEASRLEPTLGQVLAYGSDHPDVFGSYGLVWHDVGDASVFFCTGDLEPHRDALESIVEFPDDLIVCQVSISGQAAQALEATLVAELRGRFLSIGRDGSGVVDVAVRADEIDLARELELGYRLPPGEYDIVGVIPLLGGDLTSPSTAISVGG